MPIPVVVLALTILQLQRATEVAETLSWQKGPVLRAGRDHHATFVTSREGRARLWVAGGNDYRHVFGDVWSAEVRPDGSVGDWEASDSLPMARAGHSVATDDRTVIIAGGQDSTLQKVTELWVASVGDDGRLGRWRHSTPLPAPRFHHAMVLHREWLYLVGGLETRESVPGVFRARMNRDGTVGVWEPLADLPRPRSHHAMVVHDGALYLVGGLDGNPAGQNTPLDDVLRAEIKRDGTLGKWREVSRLPHAYATHASASFGGALWLFGGVEDNARFVDVVLRAPVARDGSVGGWSAMQPGLPAARSHVHQVPVVNGRAYSVGGSNRRVVTGDLYFAALEGAAR